MILCLVVSLANALPQIVNGEPSIAFKYPWLASLQENHRHICGGTLLNPTTIVTAAHCSAKSKFRTMTIKLHRHNLKLSDTDENGITLKVTKIIIHPNYNRKSLENDVAIWKLVPNAELTRVYNTYRSFHVDIANATSFTREGSMLQVAGWGATTEGGKSSEFLLETELPVVDKAFCAAEYEGGVGKNAFCAGYPIGGADTCQGDSGGPIFTTSSRSTTLVGITSFGHGCGSTGTPGVYTNVAAYPIRDFIDMWSE
jgi:trypsin